MFENIRYGKHHKNPRPEHIEVMEINKHLNNSNEKSGNNKKDMLFLLSNRLNKMEKLQLEYNLFEQKSFPS